MKNSSFIIVGLIGGVIGGYFLFKGDPPTSIPPIKPVTITEYLPVPVKEYIPELVYIDTGTHSIKVDSVWVELWLPVDSAAIVADYLKVREYHIDTTVKETNAVLDLNIFANRLLKYDLIITSTHVCQEPSNKGLSVGVSAGVHSLSPTLAYEYNRFTILGAYNVYEGTPSIGVLYKLNK